MIFPGKVALAQRGLKDITRKGGSWAVGLELGQERWPIHKEPLSWLTIEVSATSSL